MSPGLVLGGLVGGAYVAGVANGRKGWMKVVPAMLLAGTLAPVSKVGAAALVACGLGDAFLLDKGRFFVHGLGAFLVGHVLLVGALSRVAPEPWSGVGALPFLLVVAIGLRVAWPGFHGVLRGAAPVYGLALVALGGAAAAVGPGSTLGAGLFVCSDGILAFNRFVRPIRGAEVGILSTYYAALLLLTAALLP